MFWTVFKPDLGLAYDITNPSQPFTFKGPESAETESTEPEPELSFNETLAALREGGCAFVEGEPDNLDPDRCEFLSQQEFLETALDRKLVFMHEGEEAYTLYVPVKDGHVAWRWPREPA
ncbi:MAG: hypothetical protein ABIJ47_02580 [Candidatus Bathyarchaeota archaeon]